MRIPGLVLIGLALLLPVLASAQDELPFHGPDFTLRYPRKDSTLQPASASVPFQLEYRKNSLFRLETERLTQPIDLTDPTFAEIFMEVQLEKLRERVDAPLETQRIRAFSWGPGVEFVYYLPARSGGRDRRDLVTEIVTTAGPTLYRFTYWIPERDLRRVAAPFAQLVESFEPVGARAADTETIALPTPPPGVEPVSLAEAEKSLEEYRREIEDGGEGEGGEDTAATYAGLVATLGWKAYLEDGASSQEIEEMRRAVDESTRAAPNAPATKKASAWLAYHENRMVEMESALKEALAIDEDDAETHVLYALWYGFSPRRAEEMARKAIESDPELASAYFVKARADRGGSDLTEARQALEKTVELDPTFVLARIELAEVLKESGATGEALTELRTAVAADPSHVSARFRLAVALRQEGHVDEAITEYENVLSLDPSLPEVYYNLAVLFLNEKQQPEAAAQNFRRFLELSPDSPQAERVRSWLSSNGYR